MQVELDEDAKVRLSFIWASENIAINVRRHGREYIAGDASEYHG